MGKKEDLTGKRFGRLVVLSREGADKCLCKCDCGTIKLIATSALRSGLTTSCRCYHRELVSSMSKRHGMSKTRVYHIWTDMKARCSHENNKHYKHYGGRGITVCEEWLNSFDIFYNDMGDPPTKKHTIDRIDNNGNYEPVNCKWSTYTEQALNRRSNVLISFNGETKTALEWAQEIGLPPTTIYGRIRRGFTRPEEVLSKTYLPRRTSG